MVTTEIRERTKEEISLLEFLKEASAFRHFPNERKKENQHRGGGPTNARLPSVEKEKKRRKKTESTERVKIDFYHKNQPKKKKIVLGVRVNRRDTPCREKRIKKGGVFRHYEWQNAKKGAKAEKQG